MFFENLAHLCGFDPKNPRKWERISERWKKFRSKVFERGEGREGEGREGEERLKREDSDDFQGIKTILSYHGGSLSSALIDLFPDIGIEPAKFSGNLYSLAFLFLFLLFSYSLVER